MAASQAEAKASADEQAIAKAARDAAARMAQVDAPLVSPSLGNTEP